MSKTQRNIPYGKLTDKEKKLAAKNKLKHGLSTSYKDTNYSQSGKKHAKKESHRKQRINANKEIKNQVGDL
jgi:hypothetical protein